MLTLQVRATIYNIFRIPLNFIVVVVLANLKSLHDDLVFTLCACFLALAAVLQVFLKKYKKNTNKKTQNLHPLRLLFGTCCCS
jgi:type II secretory pathway component PulF